MKVRALTIVPSSSSQPLLAAPPSVEPAVSPPSPEKLDMYGTLAAECRVLGQRLRALREHRSDVDAEIEAALRDYDEKREQLLAIMDEGAPS